MAAAGDPTRWRALAVLAVVTVAFGASMFAVPGGIAGPDEFRNNDWLNCRSFDAFSRRALLQDGQFPLRSHLFGGGFPVAAHPSDGSWAPTILPTLLFGDVVGVKLVILAFILLGAWGIRGLARDWLGLPEPAALGAAALFAVSGWLPSMILVGFYNQVLFCAAPALLHLLLTSGGRPARLLVAGALYALVLQQGQHAFPAIGFFLAVTLWMQAAADSGADRGALTRWGLPVGALLVLTAAPAFARHLGWWPLVVGWGGAAGLLVLPRMRAQLRSFRPHALRLGTVLAVACLLGAARLAGLASIDATSEYRHVLLRDDALWFPQPHGSDLSEERFYTSPAAFLRGVAGRAPAEMTYRSAWGRQAEPTQPEYAWLGLTWVGVVLAGLGLLAALREPRAGPLVAVGALFAGICFGWNAPPDLHFLLTWGVPRLDDFAQPIKYWNFFVLMAAVLLVAVAATRIARAAPAGPARTAVVAAAALGLLWPFLQNRAALGEAFSVARPAPEAEAFHQVAQIAEPWWLEQDDARIRAMSAELLLREKVRAPAATEYFNVRRGVGTIDWYGSILLPEFAVPKSYVTLTGEVLANPRYRGEAWIEGGEGAVRELVVKPNTIDFVADLSTPGSVVINQNHLAGFRASTGRLVDRLGLLSVDLPAGEHRVRLTYRPPGLLAGFAVSGLSLLAWMVALAVLVRRR